MVTKKERFKRWAVANKVYLIMVALVIILAYIDTIQINAFFGIDTVEGWDLYNTYVLPSFIKLWVLLFVVASVVYYLFAKDISEAVGLFLGGIILLYTGVEDVFYFLFSPQSMTQCMSWFNELGAPVAYFSTYIMREQCVSPLSLYLMAIIGVILSYSVFVALRNYKPR